MLRTSVTTANAINILVALKRNIIFSQSESTQSIFNHLARMFGKINTGSEHSSYIGVSLTKTFLDYRLNKRKMGYNEYYKNDILPE